MISLYYQLKLSEIWLSFSEYLMLHYQQADPVIYETSIKVNLRKQIMSKKILTSFLKYHVSQ